MAGQRTAGYCTNCNRGVSIIRPPKSGLVERMKSALNQAEDDSNWVCTKCGQPATRGFAPPPEMQSEQESTPPIEGQESPGGAAKEIFPDVEPSIQSDQTRADDDLSSETIIPASDEASAGKNIESEATCHLCSKPIPFNKEAAGDQSECPTCHAAVILPDVETDSTALTSSPIVMKLDDDPDRPEISKALCTQCNFELTYPKRLGGKNVDCPSCSVKFILP